MEMHSQITRLIEQGYVLDIRIEDARLQAYVVISEPDLERVADIVPPEEYEAGGDVHVMAVEEPALASGQVQDVLFNMNPDDIAVFLCAGADCLQAVLAEFGQDLAGTD